MSDIDSQNNSNSNQSKTSNWGLSRICLIAFLVILVYCVSFGPVVYVFIKAGKSGLINKNNNNLVFKASLAFYTPHVIAMLSSEIYFNYIKWWFELGGEKMPLSYAEYKNFENM